MKFPVARKHPPLICPGCKKKKVGEPHDMAILIAGALRKIVIKKTTSLAEITGKNHRGFISIAWHTHGTRTREAYIDVAVDGASGQSEIYFCSTKCMRAFFNACVDELEKERTV